MQETPSALSFTRPLLAEVGGGVKGRRFFAGKGALTLMDKPSKQLPPPREKGLIVPYHSIGFFRIHQKREWALTPAPKPHLRKDISCFVRIEKKLLMR